MAAIEADITPIARKQTSESAILLSRGSYQDYSADRKAEVLAMITAHNGNVAQVARLANIPHQTIRVWLEQADRYSELQIEKQADLATKLENNAHKLANSIGAHDLTIVPLAAKATALGIMVDKMQLLRGQPTSINLSLDRGDLSSFLDETLGDVIDVTPEATEG